MLRAALLAAPLAMLARAQPQSGIAPLGSVMGNTPGNFETFTWSFVPTVGGSNFVLFAFRQDPAYWTLSNADLLDSSGAGLLVNSNFSRGGLVTTNLTSLEAPADWGVAYASGYVPSAAGVWSPGQWRDGAVGAWDSIYQAANVTVGSTYTVGLRILGDNVADGTSVSVYVYAAPCDNAGDVPPKCVLPASLQFTPVATPEQTVNPAPLPGPEPAPMPVPAPVPAPAVQPSPAPSPLPSPAPTPSPVVQPSPSPSPLPAAQPPAAAPMLDPPAPPAPPPPADPESSSPSGLSTNALVAVILATTLGGLACGLCLSMCMSFYGAPVRRRRPRERYEPEIKSELIYLGSEGARRR